jgi:hypothetical protein
MHCILHLSCDAHLPRQEVDEMKRTHNENDNKVISAICVLRTHILVSMVRQVYILQRTSNDNLSTGNYESRKKYSENLPLHELQHIAHSEYLHKYKKQPISLRQNSTGQALPHRKAYMHTNKIDENKIKSQK